MKDAPRLSGYDETPVYTMKTVVQQTGITPTTLRAWERRYGILRPDRSDGGYRLYSEHDIALLRWLKSQVEAGVNIGRAVALLELKRQDNGGIAAPVVRFRSSPEPEVAVPSTSTRHTETIVEELLKALLVFCETRASAILSEAFALYPLETVTEHIIAPSLVEVGERWQNQSISVVQANFVASFLRQRVTAMFAAYSQPGSGPLAVTGSAPGEWHDIGILMVALALRRQGWRVIHLGANVPARQLVDELPSLQPELVCLSATTLESAQRLLRAVDMIGRLPEPHPRFVFGGRAFNLHPELYEGLPGAFLGAIASEAAGALVQA